MALQALGQTGGMASGIENQSFGEQAAKASANDQMNRFNTQNQVAMQQRNIGAQNQAQAGNLANAQQISNQNVQGTNQEQYAQLQRQMQQYNANLQHAEAYGAPLQAYGQAGANQAYGQGQATSNAATGIAGGMNSGMMFGALSQYMKPAASNTPNNAGAGPTMDAYNNGGGSGGIPYNNPTQRLTSGSGGFDANGNPL
jgi:hypothetical protein